MRLVTRQEMVDIDRKSTSDFGVSVKDLMEAAGARLAQHLAPLLKGRRKNVIFLCGKGNNGGDGFVAARLLKKRYRLKPRVILLYPSSALKGDALSAFERWQKAGGTVEILVPQGKAFKKELLTHLADADLIVDGIFGTGLKKAGGKSADSYLFEVIEIINQVRRENVSQVVAIDIPSGLDADSGAPVSSQVIQADSTFTLGLPKIGMMTSPGSEFSGDIKVLNSPFPKALIQIKNPPETLIEPRAFRDHLRRRSLQSQKGQYGHTFVIAGSRQMPGAALMATAAALSSGTGKVTAIVPGSDVSLALAPNQPEAMWFPAPNDAAGFFSKKGISEVMGFLKNAAAKQLSLVVGPGLGTNEGAVELVRALVDEATHNNYALVLDADALNIWSKIKFKEAFPKRQAHEGPIVLTPHPGELGRLLGCSAEEIQKHRLERAREAANIYRAWIVLKGYRTVIASPPLLETKGEVIYPFSLYLDVNPTGNPGMAKGGMGDVLAGILGARLATVERTSEPSSQPLEKWREALQAAVYIHGYAGDLAKKKHGEEALLPHHIIECLGRAFMQVKKKTR